MAKRITAVPLTLDLVRCADADLRMADRTEWLAGVGAGPVETLAHGWTYGRAALDEDGQVLCFWGAEPDGSVWLAATNRAVPRARAIHRLLKEEFQKVQEVRLPGYPLYAFADSRNVLHHAWLEWLGFKYVREEFWGVLGLPFKLYIYEVP